MKKLVFVEVEEVVFHVLVMRLRMFSWKVCMVVWRCCCGKRGDAFLMIFYKKIK